MTSEQPARSNANRWWRDYLAALRAAFRIPSRSGMRLLWRFALLSLGGFAASLYIFAVTALGQAPVSSIVWAVVFLAGAGVSSVTLVLSYRGAVRDRGED